MIIPCLSNAIPASEALAQVQKPPVHKNRRVEGLSPSIAVLEKMITEYDRYLSPHRYRLLSLKWLKAHLSLAAWKAYNLLIYLVERVSSVWGQVLRRRISWPRWVDMEQRRELCCELEALKRNRHLASSVAKATAQGELAGSRLERLPRDLQSEILSFLTPKDQLSLISSSRSLDQLAPIADHLVVRWDSFLSTGRRFEKTRFLYLYMYRSQRKFNTDLCLDKIKSNFNNVRFLSLSTQPSDDRFGLLDLSDEREVDNQGAQAELRLSHVVLESLWWFMPSGIFKTIMERSPRLSFVKLSFISLEGEDRLALVQYGKRIKALHLHDEGMDPLFLRNVMRQCTQLKELYLNYWDGRNVRYLLESGAFQITSLHVPNWRTDAPLSRLIEGCKEQKQLKRLTVGALSLDDCRNYPQFSSWSRGFPNTEKQSLHSLSDGDLRAITQFLPQLEELILNCIYTAVDVTDEGLKALAKGCNHLRHLKLFGFEFSDHSLQTLATHCPQLSSIWSGEDNVEWRREASGKVEALEE